MTAIFIANRLLGLLSASALLMCGAILLALSPWAPGLRWAAADAKVREAAEEFVSAHTHYMCANERMNGIAYMAKCDAQAALHIAVAERKAALAAWKGE